MNKNIKTAGGKNTTFFGKGFGKINKWINNL